MVFDVRVDNVGPTPIPVRVSLLVDGELVGQESEALTVVPPLHRRFACSLPLPLFARVDAGARLEARIRYRHWWTRTVTVARGQRRSV